MEQFRSEVAVKLRGASYGDRAAVLAQVEEHRAEHATRLAHYEQLAAAYDPGLARGPRPRRLPGAARRDPPRAVLGRLADRVPHRPHHRRSHRMTVPAPPRPVDDRAPHAAQPDRDGLDAHRPRGQGQAPARARGVLRRAGPRRRRPDRHRRLLPQRARLAAAVRLDDDPRASTPTGTARSPTRCTPRAARSPCRCCTPAATATPRSTSRPPRPSRRSRRSRPARCPRARSSGRSPTTSTRPGWRGGRATTASR